MAVKKLGFLYAGQGSQKSGMGKAFYESSETFRKAFESAELDFDLKTLCFEGGEMLDRTRYTQPCMVAFAAGVTAVLKEKGIEPMVVAGLSLGEYSALHAAGVFDAKTAIEVAAFRGTAMEQAAEGVESAMVAVIGLEREKLAAACQSAASFGTVVIANYNCPGQLVIGGEKAAVEEAARLAKETGARRCLPLKVSGPFHTPLMAPAGEALGEYFRQLSFSLPSIPVIFNCLADVQGEETIPELLVRQVRSSVYMEDSIRKMGEMGVEAIVEIGPGNALSGFVKKTLPGMRVYNVETPEDVEKLLEVLL